MNKIFKTVIEFKKIIQNIQITLDQILHGMGWFWLNLNCPVYCLRIFTLIEIFFKNYRTQAEINLKPFALLVIYQSKYFVGICKQVLYTIHTIFC